MDFMQKTLARFYEDIDWTEKGYSNLDSFSNEILDFQLLNSLLVSFGKDLSSNLKSSYSLGTKDENSLGYLYSSKGGLLSGRIYDDLRLEAIYCKRLNSNLLFATSALSKWNKEIDSFCVFCNLM
jgi:hypothetical protein